MQLSRRAALLGVAALSTTLAAQAQTFQFDAAHGESLTLGPSGVVSEWRARAGAAALTPAQGSSNGWCHAVARTLSPGRRTLDLAVEGAASPFRAAGATGGVSYAFAVVRCEAPADPATLFDAPCSARLEPAPWPGDPWAFSAAQLAETAAYAVNGTATNAFAGSAGFQLVEVFWTAPAPLEALYVGGSPASPLWDRTWKGELAELVLLAAPPAPAERAALWSYAALKWGAPAPSGATGVRQTLDALGVSTGSLFASLVLVR